MAEYEKVSTTDSRLTKAQKRVIMRLKQRLIHYEVGTFKKTESHRVFVRNECCLIGQHYKSNRWTISYYAIVSHHEDRARIYGNWLSMYIFIGPNGGVMAYNQANGKPTHERDAFYKGLRRY